MKSYGKISCFSTEGKMVFSSFSKRYFIFMPFKRDTTIINSFSLYRCKNLLRYYRSLSINMVNFLQFWNLRDALLNACFSQTVLAFKVVINNSCKLLKFLLIKHNFCFSFKLSLRLKLRINIPNAVWSFRFMENSFVSLK